MLLVAVAVCLWAARAGAAPIRVLVAAGEARGLAEQGVLKHANQDAERVRNVFVRQGRVDPGRAFLVQNATKQSLFAALGRARATARTHPRDEVTLIFYFSGHGDRTHLDLHGEAVPLGEIRRRVNQIPAGLRLVIIDACRTTDPMRKKGVSAASPFSIAVNPSPATGSVWLYATADGEAAQESDALAGAVFTHFFVNGLRGAADENRDHRVTLGEAWSFAYHQTLYRSARGSGVLQRPAAKYDLAQSAPLVLTYKSRRDATLTLPPARDTHYLVYATGSKTVAAELWAVPAHPAAVSLPPGQYVVQRRGRGGAAAIRLSLGSHEKRTLHNADFRPVAVEELAAKGGTLVLRPSEVFISAGATTGTLAPVMPRLGVGAARRIGNFALGLRIAGSAGRHVEGANNVRVVSLDSTLELDRLVELPPFELRVGLGPTLMFIDEDLRRRDADVIGPLGYSVDQDYRAVALGGSGGVAARLGVGDVLFVELALRGGALGVRRQSNTSLLWLASAAVDGGYRF